MGSSTPATSLNVTFFWELDARFARLFPIDRRLLPPLCIWRMKKTKNPMIRRSGAHENSRVAHGLLAAFLAVTATSRSTSVLTSVVRLTLLYTGRSSRGWCRPPSSRQTTSVADCHESSIRE